MKFPTELLYAETHEWVRVSEESENEAASKKKGAKQKPKVKAKAKPPAKKPSKKKRTVAVIGITSYAVSKLSDLVHIELPAAGNEVKQGESIGEIESVKTVSELYSPVSGTVIEVNGEVKENIEIIAKDPYDEGWLVKIEIAGKKETADLMKADDYKEFIQTSEEESSEEEEDDEEEGADEDYFV